MSILLFILFVKLVMYLNQLFLATVLKDYLGVSMLLVASSQHPIQSGLNNKRNVLAPITKIHK